jgi:peptidyl-prolyl cis-trans isomerase SurA
MAFSSLSVAAGGTVAVTGDGTSAATPLKPTVGDGNAATGTDDGTSKKKKKSAKKSAPASDDSETETASREMSVPTGGAHAIVALVNDEPVTGFEIEQRAMMLSGSEVQNQAKAVFESIIKNPKTSERLKGILKDVVKANEGKSRDEIIAIFEKRKKEFGMSLQKQAFDTARAGAMPAVRKQALEELIDERLKVQEAKKQSVTIEDADVDRIVKGIAERNKMTLDQFAKQLGGSIDPIKTRIRATLAWNEVVRRRFGPLININAKDVDKLVATTALGTSDAVELQVQLVSVSMPAKREDAEIAQRIQEADKLRSKFSDCKSTEGIVAGVAGAKFEDLGKRRPSIFPEPTRSMLLNASDGEMLPPRVGDSAIELWVVCGHTALKAEDEKRTTAENELKQKEFEVMAKRYLKDLREDAHIEYR